ncbi:unnamed protein product [Prorocentrum cordatum]|uniref:Uncharacterized protein n=1 Tax=Prorocentrum cordatum TaxID=2364126 RepID=A0ABN9X8M0_9DINO|nr:unnamed protein product [Polarella glacialis]
MAASRLLGATRCAALPAVGRRAITVVSRGPWSFEFEAKGAVLHAQYGLPPKLPCPQEAIAEWSGPIADEVRRGPTELMGSSSERTLRNAACVLRFLDDVQSAAAGLARQERPMEALVLSRDHDKLEGDERPGFGACPNPGSTQPPRPRPRRGGRGGGPGGAAGLDPRGDGGERGNHEAD